MRPRLCDWFVVLTLAATLPATAGAADKPSTAGDAVYLVYREPNNVSDADAPPPFLARELMRQAVLIAARDECGLRTPDATLGEKIPDSPSLHVVPFDLHCRVARVKKGFDVRYTLSRTNGKATEKLGEWSFLTDVFSPKMIINLADLAERMSRGKLKNLLTAQGLGKSVPAPREFAGVPRETTERLWEWNEITVLGALRRIHAEIRAKGESPELVGGLAVGYANLGSLTASYLGPAHKAFFARALLYAERLVHESDESDWALWHRAYVRALVGLHNAARLDVKAARKAWDKKTSPQPPFWADILEPFCDGQLPQMMEKAKNHRQQRLARYLKMQAVMYSDLSALTIQTCSGLLQDCPDCLRAADALCSTRMIGPMRMVTDSAFSLLSNSLRRRLPDVHRFPASLAKRVTDAKPPDETAGDKATEDEIEFRVQLVADIKAETTSGRDTLEPSLDVLGNLIEEIQFLQVVRRLELENTIWAVQTEPTISTYRPLCAHHPYAAFLDSYSDDPADVGKTYKAILATLDPSEMVMLDWRILNWLRVHGMEPGTTWLRIAWAHADPVWSDEMYGLDQGIAGQPDERHTNKPHMDMMWDTSSRIPAAVAIQVFRNWYRARTFMGTVENDYGDDPILMASLSTRFYKLKQWDNAERCTKKWIANAPDYGAYGRLAAIYKEKGDLVHWKETLVKSFDLPSNGLEQAQVQNQLAHYHMDRKEWSEAVTYADAAAQSYSGWGMMTACRCHEMLGEWEKAEMFVRATSERYDTSRFEWMLWCHRTGHGDADAADNCARTYFESLGTNKTHFVRQQDAIYYLLRKEPEKAQTVFELCFEKGHEAYNALHAALIADTLGKTAERDRLLAEIVNANLSESPRGHAYAGMYKEVVELLQKALPPGSVKDLDFKKIEAVIHKAPEIETPTNFEYFIGMFLKNRGDNEKSREYLIRCAQSELIVKYTHMHARQTLRDLNIPLPPKAVAQSSQPKK
jgi:tetratricopeptide (TPR) repeat protein